MLAGVDLATNSKKSMGRLRILGYYQIAGGVQGIFLLLNIWSPNWDKRNVEVFAIPIALLFIILASVGALQVFKNKKLPLLSVWISMFLQILQVVSFSLKGITYTFCAGSFIGLRVSENIELIFNLFLIEFKISLVSTESFISINFIPFVVIGLLYSELLRIPSLVSKVESP